MRIGLAFHKSPAAKGGGILSYVLELTNALELLGHSVVWFAPGPGTECRDRPHVTIDPYGDPRANAVTFLNACDEYAIEGIISNDNPVAQMAAPAVKSPFISVAHYSSKIIAALACYRHEWVDYVVAISSDMQCRLTSRYAVPSFKVPLVYNGVAESRDVALRSVSQHDLLNICFAGGALRYKGADLALELASRSERPGQLHWFGGLTTELQRKVEVLDGVKSHGSVTRDEFRASLGQCDVILVPSRSEGCPMAMLEAMSVGVLPITSNGIGAMSSLVLHGESGYVCPLKSWADHALQCLLHLNANRSKLQKMRDRARDRFESNFRSLDMAQRLVGLLQEPTVDRSRPATHLDLIQWHRWPDPSRSTFADKCRFHLGILKRVGSMAMPV